MKRISILLSALAVLAAATLPVRAQESMESQISTRLGKAISLSADEVKANEVVKAHAAYSGIAVDVIKTSNRLQLFNPFAPARYGSAEDNTLRDSITGRASGWKLFSIRF